MKVKRFVGEQSRLLLQQVREELGADAVILSNRMVADGMEILAMRGADMAGLIDDAPVEEAKLRGEQAGGIALKDFARRAGPDGIVDGKDQTRARAVPNQAIATDESSLPQTDARRIREDSVPKPTDASPRQAPNPFAKLMLSNAQTTEIPPNARSVGGGSGTVDAEAVSKLLVEVRAMKSLLGEQVAAMAWGESVRRRPLRGALLRELLAAGFGMTLARTVTEKLPDDFSDSQGRQWVHGVLARNIRLPTPEGIVNRGGVFALVGPTGVGKTTTAAKIAAQCVVEHGVKSLGLITTDSYRVGAHDQLRIYGRILGVPVFVAQDAPELENALAAMTGKHLVLIDTIGMGQRDCRMPEQQALLSTPGIERLLLLNATAQTETLEDVVNAYGMGNIYGAIITKADEAVRLGGVLDVLIRRRLTLHFVTNGQRVPEDIHAGNPRELVEQSMHLVEQSAEKPDLMTMALAADSAWTTTQESLNA